MEKFTFFYRSAHPFSQWYPASFTIDGIRFNCAEQYMMYGKALLFDDKEIGEKILKAQTPREQKALGRKVRNFVPEVWEANCKDIVYKANKAKFEQNADIKKTLLETKGTTLVEASPTDNIWGIGLAEDDARAYSRQTWRGTNWLGEVLTRLRDDLLAGQ